MSEIMWCAAVSHNDFTGLGRPRDFAAHQLGHAIGAIYDKVHAETITVLWEGWARYVLHKDPAQFARYAKNVWGAEGAEAGIEATVSFFKEIKMPVSFSELGIGILPETALDALAFTCTYQNTRTVGKFVVLGYEEIRSIYALANK
jgi:alcohol dehydrogenase YqhD (iron-dependent ADH family)